MFWLWQSVNKQTKIPTSRLIILNYSLFKEKELAWKRHKQKIVNTEYETFIYNAVGLHTYVRMKKRMSSSLNSVFSLSS